MTSFYYDNQDGFITLKCRALDRLNVKHCFTTRLGGVSTDDKAYTNMSFSREPYDTVAENYRRAQKSAGFSGKFALTRQTHTDRVIYVGDTSEKFYLPDCDTDGLITDRKGLCLCVFTADCTPVLLADKKGRAVSAVHSGWRGTVGNIAVKSAVQMKERFGVQPCDIVAVIGPHINKCCYEVGKDVYDEFVSLGDIYSAFLHPRKDRYMLDMGGAVEYSLREYGVSEIYRSNECTYCRNDGYYSHRKTGNARGNTAAMIEL